MERRTGAEENQPHALHGFEKHKPEVKQTQQKNHPKNRFVAWNRIMGKLLQFFFFHFFY